MAVTFRWALCEASPDLLAKFKGRRKEEWNDNGDEEEMEVKTRSSAIAEGPRDASCQLKSCQLPRNSAETTYATSPDEIDGMKLEI